MVLIICRCSRQRNLCGGLYGSSMLTQIERHTWQSEVKLLSIKSTILISSFVSAFLVGITNSVYTYTRVTSNHRNSYESRNVSDMFILSPGTTIYKEPDPPLLSFPVNTKLPHFRTLLLEDHPSQQRTHLPRISSRKILYCHLPPAIIMSEAKKNFLWLNKIDARNLNDYVSYHTIIPRGRNDIYCAKKKIQPRTSTAVIS